MASHRVQKWIERREEVKANLAALIDSHLLANSDGQPKLDGTSDGCTDGTRKQAQKLTAVMRESQEQQKRNNKKGTTRTAQTNQRKHQQRNIGRTTRRLTISILKAKQPKKGQ